MELRRGRPPRKEKLVRKCFKMEARVERKLAAASGMIGVPQVRLLERILDQCLQ